MHQPLFSLAGRTALITGAARGLGAAMAEALGRAGAHVYLNDIQEASLSARCASMKAGARAGSGARRRSCSSMKPACA